MKPIYGLTYGVLILAACGGMVQADSEDCMSDMHRARGWQGTNFIVGTGVGANPGPLVSIVQAVFDEPGEYTVQIQPFNPPQDSRLIGVVNWSVEGGQLQRMFDVGNGMQISGVANGVSVSVQDNSGSAHAAGIQYQVGAQVALGLRPPSGSPVMLYGPSEVIAPAGLVVVPIPQNAGVNSVQIGITTGNDNAIPVVEAKISAAQFVFGWRIPEIAPFVAIPTSSFNNTLQLTNEDAATTANVYIIWGIDG